MCDVFRHIFSSGVISNFLWTYIVSNKLNFLGFLFVTIMSFVIPILQLLCWWKLDNFWINCMNFINRRVYYRRILQDSNMILLSPPEWKINMLIMILLGYGRMLRTESCCLICLWRIPQRFASNLQFLNCFICYRNKANRSISANKTKNKQPHILSCIIVYAPLQMDFVN